MLKQCVRENEISDQDYLGKDANNLEVFCKLEEYLQNKGESI